MLSHPDPSSTLLSPHGAPRHADVGRYGGPERRSVASLEFRRLAQLLDEIDYGTLLLDRRSLVQHVNRSALRDLDDTHPLRLVGSTLHARSARDAAPLRDALNAAAGRGLRRLLRLGEGAAAVAVSVVPLPALGRQSQCALLLSMGRRRMCDELSADWFALHHGLTPAETQVLKGLCDELTPQQLAARQHVSLTTIRTQIGSIRTKTGSASIHALLRQVAMLPPMASMLTPGLPRRAEPAQGRRRRPDRADA